MSDANSSQYPVGVKGDCLEIDDRTFHDGSRTTQTEELQKRINAFVEMIV